VTLPNQGGAVQIDGISVPASSVSSVQVIQGYHTVRMLSTDFYETASMPANAVEGNASVTFPTKLSSTAIAAAAASIKAAFGNETCDVKKYYNCPNHLYKVQAGYYDTLPAPGGDIRANTSWSIAFTGDPTSSMTLVVTSVAGQVTGSGTCAMTLTVDGSKIYHFTGTWTATLTWANGDFGSDVLEDCDKTRA
jgi:hypothetical protein